MNFLKENLGTIIVSIILIIIVILIIRKMIIDKKKGKSLSCGGDCSHCLANCNHRTSD